jgi:hypothetical protein
VKLADRQGHKYACNPTLDILRGIALQVRVERCLPTLKARCVRVVIKRNNGVAHSACRANTRQRTGPTRSPETTA